MATALRFLDALHWGDPTYADALRWVNLGLAAFLAGKTLVILWTYFSIRKRARSRPLVWHIVCVSTGVFILVSLASVDSVNRLDTPFDLRIIAKFAAYIIILWGLRWMSLHLRYERKQKAYIFNQETHCPACGSDYVAQYCATCGARQPGFKG